MRVAPVLRSAEVQPLFRDLCICLLWQAECQFHPPIYQTPIPHHPSSHAVCQSRTADKQLTPCLNRPANGELPRHGVQLWKPAGRPPAKPKQVQK